MQSKLMDLVIQEKKSDYIVEDYIEELISYLVKLPYHEIRRECISGYNRFMRSNCISSLDFNLRVKPGDIVYCDFGQAYINSLDSKEHLYYIGMPEGLNKPSVLFLNDAKFINTARIIEIKSSLNIEGALFQDILTGYQDLFKV